MIETAAKFARSYASLVDKRGVPINAKTVEYALLFISPLMVFWLIRVLVISVLTRRVTEFITGFALVVSARFCAMHPYQPLGVWSVIAVSSAGFVFVLLLFNVGR